MNAPSPEKPSLPPKFFERLFRVESMSSLTKGAAGQRETELRAAIRRIAVVDPRSAERPQRPTTRCTASSNEGPLSAVKPTFECPCKGVDERPEMAARCLTVIGSSDPFRSVTLPQSGRSRPSCHRNHASCLFVG
jgi:hypothetical protein